MNSIDSAVLLNDFFVNFTDSLVSQKEKFIEFHYDSFLLPVS